MSEVPSEVPSPAPPTVEHRGWSRRMVFWSVALAAFLLASAWGAANWKVFHLAYCKHLMKSTDPADQLKGTELVLQMHLSRGMTVEEVRKTLRPTKFEMTTVIYGKADLPGFVENRYSGWTLEFDPAGHYVQYSKTPLGP
jgi:hypothetical protein